MATFREVAYELAQAGQWELAMTAWTRENLRQINRGLPTEPVIDENLRQAGLWLSQKPKDGFSSFDEQILEYLLQLQKEIGNHSNLQPSIDILLNEWRTSPNQNLYDWTLQTIRTTKGPEDRVLILAALGKFLEEQVDQFARQYDLQKKWQQQKTKKLEPESKGDTNAKTNSEIYEQRALIPKAEPVHYRVKPIEGEFIPKEQESDLKRAAKQLLSDIDERIAREQQYSASFRGFKSR